MANVTEAAIYDELRTTLRSAINHCGLLSILPAMGPTYKAIIVELETIEGAARSLGFARRDAR